MNKEEIQRQAMAAMAAVAEQSLADTALERHRSMAEMSHKARLALETLTAGAIGQGIGKAEIGSEDLEAVKEALRDIQNTGHLAFLQAGGNETTYQTVGKRIAKKHKPRARKRA